MQPNTATTHIVKISSYTPGVDDDGHDPATEHKVKCVLWTASAACTDTAQGTTAADSLTISSLSPNTQYMCYVIAYNAATGACLNMKECVSV
jgi:hypothetical protein